MYIICFAQFLGYGTPSECGALLRTILSGPSLELGCGTLWNLVEAWVPFLPESPKPGVNRIV